MSSVAELREALQRDWLDRLEAPVTRKARLAGCLRNLRAVVPFWASQEQRDVIRTFLPDLEMERLAIGEALGVVVLPDETARLVRIQAFIENRPNGEPHAVPSQLLSAESVDSLRQAVAAVARIYPYPWVADPERDVRFELRDLRGGPLTLETPVHGGSLGLAAVIAIWSALAGCRATPVVWTGALGLPPKDPPPRTPVIEVGQVNEKRAEAGAAGLRLVCPAANGGGHAVKTVLEAVFEAFGKEALDTVPPPPRFDPQLALEFMDLAYVRNGDGSSWRTLAGRFDRLAQSGLAPDQRARALARRGACLTHVGDYEAAIPVLEEALTLVRAVAPDLVDAETEVVTMTHLGVARRDAYLFDHAESVLREAVELGRRSRCTVATINAISTLGQLLVATGRAVEGLEYVRRARGFYVSRHSFESPRNHTYTVAALVRAGDWGSAQAEFEEGCLHNRTWAEPSQRRTNRAYLDLAWLDGRLRRLRAPESPVPADDSWAELLADAQKAEAHYGEAHWPGPGLRRVRRAAELRVLPDAAKTLEETRNDAEALLCQGRDVQSAWQVGMVFIEAALAASDLAAAKECAERGLVFLPEAGREWHETRTDAIRAASDLAAFQREVDALLCSAQY